MKKKNKRKRSGINSSKLKIRKTSNFLLFVISIIISLFLGMNISDKVENISNKNVHLIEENENSEKIYKVMYISDGDTLTLKENKNGKLQEELIKVRLYGIDAPEKDQDYGLESKEHLLQKIKNKNVELEVKSKDRYNRIVGIIWIENRNINEEMIRDGYAWYYEQYDKNNEKSRIYQENAMKNKLGLFSKRKYEKPWEYRKNKKDNNKNKK